MRLGALAATSTLCCAGIEGYARSQHLDRRQGAAIAVSGRQVHESAEGRPDPTGDWGVSYLPRGLQENPRGFTTPWGACDLDHNGRTVLVLGDSVTRQGSPGDQTHANTWPLQLDLPADTQLCVLAEDGYHPGEYAALARKVRADGLAPDLTLVLLCENDVMDVPARYPVQLDDRLALYEPPSHTLAFAPLWQPTVYRWSEAFRFAHWRLAQDRPDHAVEIATQAETVMQVVPSLNELQGAGPTLIWYVPSLERVPQRNVAHQLATVQDQVPGITVLDVGETPKQLRRQADDRVHLNDQGHAVIARQMQPDVTAALSQAGP